MNTKVFQNPIDPDNVPLALEQALFLAQVSELAYTNFESLAGELAPSELRVLETFDIGNTQGFLAGNSDFHILAFRGTERSFGDWLRNLEMAPRAHAFGPVHGGFSNGLDQVWKSTLVPHFQQDESTPIWMTGHSLGAALATLAATRVFTEFPGFPIAGVITYGQPRLASKDFRKAFESSLGDRLIRVVNHRDLVTRLPPGYRHVGRRWWLNGEGGLEEKRSLRLESTSGTDAEALSHAEYIQLLEEMPPIPDSSSSLNPAVPKAARLEGAYLPGARFIKGIRDHSLTQGYLPQLNELIHDT